MTGTELKNLRLRLSYTQTQMAQALGISRTAVAKLEAGINTMSKPVAMLAAQLVEKVKE